MIRLGYGRYTALLSKEIIGQCTVLSNTNTTYLIIILYRCMVGERRASVVR